MDRLFTWLEQRSYLRTDDFAAFVAGAAELLSELNAIHPFREGNGRAQLAFLHILAETGGHPLAFERVRQATFIPAIVASFGGDLRPLIGELTALRG
jgi:cell filamentation protein